jgi:hypothetical protein
MLYRLPSQSFVPNKNVAQGDKLLDSPSKGGANAMAVTYEVVTQVVEG